MHDDGQFVGLEEAAEASLLLRPQPTKRRHVPSQRSCNGACNELHGGDVFGKTERTRNQFRAVLEFGSSSATTLPRNKRSRSITSAERGKLNRRQSFAAAVCAEKLNRRYHGVNGVLWPKG